MKKIILGIILAITGLNIFVAIEKGGGFEQWFRAFLPLGILFFCFFSWKVLFAIWEEFFEDNLFNVFTKGGALIGAALSVVGVFWLIELHQMAIINGLDSIYDGAFSHRVMTLPLLFAGIFFIIPAREEKREEWKDFFFKVHIFLFKIKRRSKTDKNYFRLFGHFPAIEE